MNLLLLVIIVALMLKFPPGSNLDWQFGNIRLLFPLGWCLWLSVGLTVLLRVIGVKT